MTAVTHPSTNRVQHRATSFQRRTTPPARQTANQYTAVTTVVKASLRHRPRDVHRSRLLDAVGVVVSVVNRLGRPADGGGRRRTARPSLTHGPTGRRSRVVVSLIDRPPEIRRSPIRRRKPFAVSTSPASTVAVRDYRYLPVGRGCVQATSRRVRL